jgi:hypothetical protein
VPRRKVTDDDRAEALRRFLVGLADGADANDTCREVWDLHPRDNTFPGEVYMRLAAEALEMSGADRTNPIPYEGLLDEYLPECEFRGRDNQKIKFALHTPAALHGGLDPDLLDEIVWWGTDDYWQYALLGAVALIRASAARLGVGVEDFATTLADRHHISVGGGT